MPTRSFRPASCLRLAALAATALAAAACGAQAVTPSDVVTPPVDASTDVLSRDVPTPPEPDVPVPRGCSSDRDCDDGVFCNGVERCFPSGCMPGTAPCDDNATCTVDQCDEASRSCAHVPDNSACDDGMACNGAERCAPGARGANSRTGCLPPGSGSLDCDDHNICTIDTCDDASGGCMHTLRDLDGDGHVDAMCGGDDCNDANPAVHPGAAENCTNGIDDDCNGFVDAADPACHVATPGDSCAMPIVLPGPGTYRATTTGRSDTAPFGCGGLPGVTGPKVYFQFTLTATTTVTAQLAGGTSAQRRLAFATSCSPALTTGACSAVGPGTTDITINSTLPPGTYWIVAQGDMPEFYALTLSYGTTATHTRYVISTPAIPFVDVCSIEGHGELLPNADDATQPAPPSFATPPATIPFPLRMYDSDAFAPLSISSNGWLALQPTMTNSLFPQLPNPTQPNLTIAGYWLDLYTRTPGICYATVGAAPNRRFVVEWNDAMLFSDRAAHVTFEIAIDEARSGTNNTLEIVYQTVMRTSSAGGTPGVGVEDATGTVADSYASPVVSGLSLRFTPVTM